MKRAAAANTRNTNTGDVRRIADNMSGEDQKTIKYLHGRRETDSAIMMDVVRSVIDRMEKAKATGADAAQKADVVPDVLSRRFSGNMTDEEWRSEETIDILTDECPNEALFSAEDVNAIKARSYQEGYRGLALEFLQCFMDIYGMNEKYFDVCCVMMRFVCPDEFRSWKEQHPQTVI